MQRSKLNNYGKSGSVIHPFHSSYKFLQPRTKPMTFNVWCECLSLSSIHPQYYETIYYCIPWVHSVYIIGLNFNSLEIKDSLTKPKVHSLILNEVVVDVHCWRVLYYDKMNILYQWTILISPICSSEWYFTVTLITSTIFRNHWFAFIKYTKKTVLG